MRLLFSVDDGHKSDVKIANLLSAHGFNATFYIPTNRQLSVEDIKEISELHEIGGHTTSHPADMKALHSDDLRAEIETNREYLHKITGQYINKFCYPRGRYDERVIKAVKKAGYSEARTTVVGYTDIPKDPYKMHTTIHCYQRDEYEGRDWLIHAKRLFEVARGKGVDGYFHVWLHSWEVDVEKFERLLRYIVDNNK